MVAGVRRTFHSPSRRLATFRSLTVPTTCWSQHQLRDALQCFDLRRRTQQLPQLHCSQSPRAAPPNGSYNMTGLKIPSGLEPRESTPLMRIDPRPRTAACRSSHRPPLRLMVLRPCRFAFSDHLDQTQALFPATVETIAFPRSFAIPMQHTRHPAAVTASLHVYSLHQPSSGPDAAAWPCEPRDLASRC